MKPLQDASVEDMQKAMDHLSLAANREINELNFGAALSLLKTASQLYEYSHNGQDITTTREILTEAVPRMP